MTDFQAFVPEQRFQPIVDLSPDGKLVAYSCNASGQFNLWITEVGGGQQKQLTHFTDHAVRHVQWSPNGESLILMADHQGNEQYQLYAVASDGSGLTRLTDAEDRQFQLADDAFTTDGRTLVYTGNDRDERCQDLQMRDMVTGNVRRLEVEPGLWGASSVSPDGRWLLAVQLLGNADTNLYLADLTAPQPELVLVTPHREEVAHWPGTWAPDSSGFYLRCDDGREFAALSFFTVADTSVQPVATPDWDVEQVSLTPDGRTLAWTVNEGGSSRLHLCRDGVDVSLPEVPAGTVDALQVAPDGGRLAFLHRPATRPAELAVLDVETGSFRYLTDSRPPALRTVAAVEPTLVDYPTHDGRRIPAWLYRPAGDGPFPFVLSVHGGPEAQERPDYAYSGLYQYLLSRGVGVLAPNVRGSTGYGKTYQSLIHRDWGGAELGDLEHAALFLRAQEFVDGERIAVFGGSFGGFATLSCLSRLPDYWAAGVSVVGPSNLVTLAKSVPPTWRPLMAKWIGDPETEADFLLSRSPITYADRIVAPLMVVQGANDPRVVQAESDQIVAALRERDVHVRYDVYDDEGHGFTDRDNEIRALSDSAEFLLSHLVS